MGIYNNPSAFLNNHEFIFGDKIYSPSIYLISPFKGISANPADEQSFFNFRHASARCAIERSFGVLKCRWSILRTMIMTRNDADKLENIIVVFVINVVLYDFT